MRRAWVSFLCAFFLACCFNIAEVSAQQSFLLREQVAVTFEPQSAFFLLRYSSEASKRVRAIIVPPFQEGSKDDEAQAWIIGAGVVIPKGIKEISYAAIVVSDKGEHVFVPPHFRKIVHKDDTSLSSELLREKLSEKKRLLENFEVQSVAQEEALSRLRKDAELIADAGRIREVREQIEHQEQEVERLQKVAQQKKQLLSSARDRRKPKNFTRRESQLNKHLGELAIAAKKAEQNARYRRQNGESALQQKLQVLELTRYQDVDALEKELMWLRRKRDGLERRVQ